MNVSEGYTPKKSRQANQKSGEALRNQHNFPTRSVIENEWGRKPFFMWQRTSWLELRSSPSGWGCMPDKPEAANNKQH